jgi:predicted  nucleic acid-binding Zn-ribbon protein
MQSAIGNPQSAMDADLQHLIHLQQLDLAAERDRRRIADIPVARQSLDDRLVAASAAVDAVKERVAANHAARREIDKDLAALQGRLSKFKNQLMEVKTNKEYQAVQKEMAVAEEEISAQETRMLERMEEADGLARELKAAEAALKTEQAAVNAERAKLDDERSGAERNLERAGERSGVVAASRKRWRCSNAAHGRSIAVAEGCGGPAVCATSDCGRRVQRSAAERQPHSMRQRTRIL